MKKILGLLIMILVISSSTSFANKDKITIFVDGYAIETDVDPIVINGRTLVPLRAIIESFGASVLWNEEGSDPNDVYFNFYDSMLETDIKELSISNGSKNYIADGKKGVMDVAPQIINNRTMIPVRFVAEILGLEVYWDGENRTVSIYPKTPEEVERGYELVGKAIRDKHPSLSMMSQGEEELNGEIYYRFSAFENHPTHTVTLGWYYVSLERGQVYEADMSNSELTLIYSENENLNEKIIFKDKDFEDIIRNEIEKPKGNIYKSDVENIKYLDVNGYYTSYDVTNIEGIEHLTNLEYLDINQTSISDLTPISNLTKLVELAVSESNVTDIRPLKNLYNLEHLDIADNQISDTSPLEHLAKLKYLRIMSNEIRDLSSIGKIRNLEYLIIGKNPLGSLQPLNNLKKLEYLNIDENKIYEAKSLKNSVNIEVEEHIDWEEFEDLEW